MRHAGARPGYGFKIGCGQRGVVVGTAQNGLDGVVALTVQHLDRRSVGIGFPPVAPLHQRDDDGDQVQSLFSKPIFVSFALSGFAVRHFPQELGVSQGCQTFTEDVTCAPNSGVELVESTGAVKGFAHDKQCPFLADHIEGPLD